LSHNALHYPQNARKATLQACRNRPKGKIHTNIEVAAITEDMDTGIGVLLDEIERLGIAGNTYVIYISDNGPSRRSPCTPLAGGKGNLWEGGIRVPLIVRGPGVKRGVCSHTRVIGQDLFTTWRGLAGVRGPAPQGAEGGNLIPVFADGKAEVERPREEIVFHFPHYHDHDRARYGPHSAIMVGDYKLIKFYESGRARLFNLAEDMSERRDLAERMPDKVKDLEGRLTRYLKDVDAQMPKPNPDYDPNKPPVRRGRPGRRGRRRGGRRARR